ncbi:hypothetical protein BKA93DRAFT_765366, partial [Sparassis latifolia]
MQVCIAVYTALSALQFVCSNLSDISQLSTCTSSRRLEHMLPLLSSLSSVFCSVLTPSSTATEEASKGSPACSAAFT